MNDNGTQISEDRAFVEWLIDKQSSPALLYKILSEIQKTNYRMMELLVDTNDFEKWRKAYLKEIAKCFEKKSGLNKKIKYPETYETTPLSIFEFFKEIDEEDKKETNRIWMNYTTGFFVNRIFIAIGILDSHIKDNNELIKAITQ